MSAYLSHIQARARAADLGEQARQARAAHSAPTRHRPPRRLRTSAARLLLGLAMRLDHRLEPAPVPASAPCT